jgi:hypothetical protein
MDDSLRGLRVLGCSKRKARTRAGRDCVNFEVLTRPLNGRASEASNASARPAAAGARLPAPGG